MKDILEKTNIKNSELSIILKGLILAIGMTLILLVIFSVFLAYTNISESTITPIIIGVSMISVFICSMLSLNKIKKKGILNGGLLGIIYMISIYLISSISTMNFSLKMESIIMIMAVIAMGSIGGVIGVNKK